MTARSAYNRSRVRRTSLLYIALAACAQDVDVEPLGDYTTWGAPVRVAGDAPGHAGSIRFIYANPAARMATSLSPTYPAGSIIVKEVFEDEAGEPGALRYLAIMRRIDTDYLDEGGWLFTETLGPTGPEKYFNFCWARCHAAAPYTGAFYDYRE